MLQRLFNTEAWIEKDGLDNLKLLTFSKTQQTTMKKLAIALVITSVTLIGCNKEGCTDQKAANYDNTADTDDGSCDYSNSIPVITINSPSATQTVGEENTLVLNLSFEDNVELTSATITLSSSEMSGASYYLQERALDGTADVIELAVDLPDLPVLGNHHISVRASNVMGNEELEDLDFELTDGNEPSIKVDAFYADLPWNPGTPISKFEFQTTDNYALKSIKMEVFKTDASGNIESTLFEDTDEFILRDTEEDYDFEFTVSGADHGDYYKGVITVTDYGDNVKVWESEVEQFY